MADKSPWTVSDGASLRILKSLVLQRYRIFNAGPGRAQVSGESGYSVTLAADQGTDVEAKQITIHVSPKETAAGWFDNLT